MYVCVCHYWVYYSKLYLLFKLVEAVVPVTGLVAEVLLLLIYWDLIINRS